MLQPALKKNDKLANWLIGIVSVVVFVVVVALGRIEWKVDLGFDIMKVKPFRTES